MVRKQNKKNSSCPCCQSGKPYGKCCRKKVLLLKKARRQQDVREKLIKSFEENHGNVRIPYKMKAYGKNLISIGGEILEQTHTGEYNFNNLIHDYALVFFGEEFLMKQNSIQKEERHQAIKWMHSFLEDSNTKKKGHSGLGAAWLRLAYDIYTIGAEPRLKQKMKDKLIKQNFFQGKRQELWAAAWFITAGFDVEFVDEEASDDKEPEFIATDTKSKAVIAVEVKSRQRKGVLGFSGGLDKDPGEEVNIEKLLKKAYKKEKGIPLCVVIDTNLPPESNNFGIEYWSSEIERTIDKLARTGYENPCPANILFFYNDPSHYLESELFGKEKDSIWINSYIPSQPKNNCSHVDDYKKRLFKAQKQRACPPIEIPKI